MAGRVDSETYPSSADAWWEYLEKNEGLRAPKNRNHVVARIALCMLSVNCDEPLEDQLSYSLELLPGFDREIYEAIEKQVDTAFEFSDS